METSAPHFVLEMIVLVVSVVSLESLGQNLMGSPPRASDWLIRIQRQQIACPYHTDPLGEARLKAQRAGGGQVKLAAFVVHPYN